MKKIFLCCAAGMSTSMVVNKMKKSAEQQGIEVDIIAVGIDEFEATLENYQCCLLGPQIKYKLADFKKIADKENKPIAVINSMDYGMMRGDKILAEALAMIAQR
ncbi:PTS sugar transporter subunit IIB [Serratia grimesii]|uniref:PTS sugar transporter subunit IIB n=1 Tax=Serratia grimesii TaxID=82995 RepID=A0A9C7QR92_9GAMM|nr:PTS sugar transporter subunit IIB [Serratia grimesii]HCJ98447.1 PTS sugar transporter subunit IIB [Serratia grimesii]